jgi:hypothetical protein
MDRGGVGDERGSKEMDRCPLTLPQYSHQGIESDWMEAILPPTDHRLSCLTDIWAPLSSKLVSAMAHTA